MTNSLESTTEHEEIQLLLPWWVNKTLEHEQHNRVADHLKACDSCQQEVHELTILSSEIKADAQFQYDQQADMQADLNRVMQRIDLDELKKNRSSNNSASLLHSIASTIASVIAPRPILKWGAPVLAGLLVAVLGSQFWSSQESDGYTVLSSPENPGGSTQFSVHFSQSMSLEEAQQIILEYSITDDQNSEITQLDDNTFTVKVVDSIDTKVLMNTILELQGHATIDQVEIVP